MNVNRLNTTIRVLLFASIATCAVATTETVTIAGDHYEVSWICHETFDSSSWKDSWVVEGNSPVDGRDGKLWIRRSPDAPTTCAATVWYRSELPSDLLVRYHAQPVAPAQGNYANLNQFLCARELDGSELRFGRSGAYREYHRIPNYIVTFVGGDAPEGWSRVRRDPGFQIMHEAPVRSQVGREYAIAVSLHSGELRSYIDGRRVHHVVDPSPLVGGKFGIRTFRTDGWWDDIEIGQVLAFHDGSTSSTAGDGAVE